MKFFKLSELVLSIPYFNNIAVAYKFHKGWLLFTILGISQYHLKNKKGSFTKQEINTLVDDQLKTSNWVLNFVHSKYYINRIWIANFPYACRINPLNTDHKIYITDFYNLNKIHGFINETEQSKLENPEFYV